MQVFKACKVYYYHARFKTPTLLDERKDYGETRFRALGFVKQRLHALVFVETAQGIRVISFRKANKREVKQYESQS